MAFEFIDIHLTIKSDLTFTPTSDFSLNTRKQNPMIVPGRKKRDRTDFTNPKYSYRLVFIIGRTCPFPWRRTIFPAGTLPQIHKRSPTLFFIFSIKRKIIYFNSLSHQSGYFSFLFLATIPAMTITTITTNSSGITRELHDP
jgi:hypothetical protein